MLKQVLTALKYIHLFDFKIICVYLYVYCVCIMNINLADFQNVPHNFFNGTVIQVTLISIFRKFVQHNLSEELY